MKFPTKEGLFDVSIIDVLTLTCMQTLCKKRNFRKVLFSNDKAFIHKNKTNLSPDHHKKYRCKVSLQMSCG